MSRINLQPVGILANLKPESWRKVKATWIPFSTEFYLDHSVPPTEDEITNFLQYRRDQGMKGTSLWSYFSHLNCVIRQYHNFRIQNRFPRITELLKGFCKGETIKKALIFTPNQLIQFRKAALEMKGSNCYLLVHGAVAEVATSGGLRMDEVKRYIFPKKLSR